MFPKFLSFEFLALSLTNNVNNHPSKFCIVTVYRHNNPGTTSLFFSEFSSLLEIILMSFSSHFLILGDFNFWVDTPDDHYSSKFKSLLHSHGLVSPISSATHISGHTLDSVLFPSPVLSSDPSPSNTAVLPPESEFSDHSLLLTHIPFSALPTSPPDICRCYNRFDPSLFSSLCSQFLPLSTLHSLPPNLLSSFLSDALSSINNILFPLSVR